MKIKTLLAATLAGVLMGQSALAKVTKNSSLEDLSKASQNPVANLISLPFENNFNFDYGPYKKWQNVLDIQPVIPVELTEDWNLIFRVITPIIRQPSFINADESTSGLGDINPSVFLSPAKPGALVWGAGFTFVAPTATDLVLGQGKWSAGPTAVLLTMPGHWVIGVLLNNYWSFAGQSNRPKVSQFLCEYFVNYNMPKGWFLTTDPLNTANWEAGSGQKWTVPLGGGFGRVFHLGSQAVNASLEGYYNIVRPTIGPNWQLRATVSLLFPE